MNLYFDKEQVNFPYYAVIFTSILSEEDEGYEEMADRMIELASKQNGFLGIESARSEIGISVSYWKDLESIAKWRTNAEHSFAQEKGKQQWYKSFSTRIAKVEREYFFEKGE